MFGDEGLPFPAARKAGVAQYLEVFPQTNNAVLPKATDCDRITLIEKEVLVVTR
jgi:hypothetical protein